MSDPYVDPQTGVLRNRFGLATQEALDSKEADFVLVRATLLQRNPLDGNFDSTHLRAIHEYLFQDVYEWAGQFRSVSLAKAEDVRGGKIVRFAPPELIGEELKRVFDRLAAADFFKGLPRAKFARKMAALLSGINRIHPFRKEMAERSASSCVNSQAD